MNAAFLAINWPSVALGLALAFPIAIRLERKKYERRKQPTPGGCSALASARDGRPDVDEWEANGAAVPASGTGLVSDGGQR